MMNISVTDKKLKLEFDIHTIEHLGVQMYKTLPPVLSELISNSYDADASYVDIKFDDSTNNKTITVSDDGVGMTFEELNESFLRIGRNRRHHSTEITLKGRKVTGRKGLGKLAIFGIANEIEVQTVKNNYKNSFIMNLNDILSTDKEYYPDINVFNELVDLPDGTTIILKNIQRKSSFDINELKESIAKRFNFTDTGFSIRLQKDNSTPIVITTDTKWEFVDSQFEWIFPNDDRSENIFAVVNNITGKIVSTEKPLAKNQNGIFLYARGKLVNSNDFFDLKTTTSFAYNYLTGFLNVDFIDDFEKDMITTNRDGLTWENEELDDLKYWLQIQLLSIEKEWRQKREISKKEDLNKTSGIDVEKWVNTMPDKLQKNVNSIVKVIFEEDAFNETKTTYIMSELRNIIPEYPYYHWRNLHPKIREVSAEYYERGDYYHAFTEATKCYKNAVKDKSKVKEDNDYNIMTTSFGHDKILRVTDKHKMRPCGIPYSNDTLNGIEDSQRFLSQGIVVGGRNVLSHEEISDLKLSGLFTEKNCLDMLSILSYLYERLDDAIINEES